MEIVVALVSFAVGVIIGRVLHKERLIGDLRIDRSDPTSEPLLFLELDTDVRSIMCKKHVTFRVKLENFIPHK
ncbi:beta-lactamase induction signal transducer protein [Clostridiaceae bacterium]|nr:beta-lactamase induction signal transducer protein [Clostridiaceae bacterium]